MKESPPKQKTKIHEFFTKTENSEEKEENEDQSTFANVETLKCPKRKVLLEEGETDDGAAKKKRTVRKRSSIMKELGKSQMVLDCGQAVIGTTNCIDCGMVYCVDDALDVKAHQIFHLRWKYRLEIPQDLLLSMINFNSKDINEYKVYYLATLASEKFKTLIKDHMKVINGYLGYREEVNDLFTLKKRMFMIISTIDGHNLIGGICVVEKVTKVYTHLSQREIIAEDDVNDWIVGIDRIWVDPRIRKTGVAMTLLDAATTMDRQMDFRPRRLRIAFSDPTDAGISLAMKFTDTRYMQEDKFDNEILVY